MIENFSDFDKTTGLTPVAAKVLKNELERRKKQGYSASKTGIASEAIIKAFGKGEGA